MSREDSSQQVLSRSDALERVTDGVVALDADLRYTYVNEQAADILGESASELREQSVWDTVGAELVGENPLKTVVETGEQRTVERYHDNHDRWFEVRVYPGEEGLSLYLTDITERKRAETELKRQNRQLLTLVEDTSEAVYIKDIEGTYEFANETAAERFGLTPDELIGKRDEDLFDAESAAEIRAVDRWVVEHEEADTRERLRDIDGVTHVFVDRRYPFHDEEGNVAGIVRLSRDVTAQTHRERELERYRAFVENSSDTISIVDEDGVIQYMSPTSLRSAGIPPETFVGADAFEYVHPEDEAAARTTFERALATPGETHDHQYRGKRADGSWMWLESSIANRLDDDHVEGLIIVTRDITERKRYERELRGKNERLDEFASVISHDIRNPLSVALGRAQLLEAAVESEHVPPIVRALVRIEAIVDDTLTLARQGRTVAKTEPIDVGSLVGQCWGTVDTAGATLKVEDEFTICGDRDRLRHVFENLFSNSVKHGSTGSRPSSGDADAHGGTDLTVCVGRLEDGGIYVEDDGPGIPRAEREIVFEPGHKSSAGGTGFGLTIVRRIVEAHGWTVTVTESESGGARFEIRGVDLSS